MNAKRISNIIRYISTIGILIGVYFETGVFTVIFALAVSIYIEMRTIIDKRKLLLDKEFVEILDEVIKSKKDEN